MRQLVYAMRFTGRATPVSADGSVLAVTATAPSSNLTAAIGSAGLASSLEPTAGAEAAFASELTLTGETSFQEVGTIAFGDGHWVRFVTVGSGYLAAAARPNLAVRHGAVTWRVERGEGQFTGACGLITSNVLIDETFAVTDHHFGVFFLP